MISGFLESWLAVGIGDTQTVGFHTAGTPKDSHGFPYPSFLQGGIESLFKTTFHCSFFKGFMFGLESL